MSIKYMAYGYDWKFNSPAEREVYMAMADHADHKGEGIRASLGFIAWKLDVHEDTVRRHVKSLVKAGILVQVGKNGAIGRANEYRIDATKGQSKGAYTRKDATPRKMQPLAPDATPGGSIQMQPIPYDQPSDQEKSTKVDLQSADADVQSAPSHPQGSNGQPNSPEMPDSSAETTSTQRGRIPDLPKGSAEKVSAETAPTVKRAPLPHIGVIEAFLAPFLKDLPPDFKIGSCARVGMDLVKAGVTIDTMREAGLLYRAWYDATPGHQPSQLSWTVAGVTVAIRTALALAKAGIGGSQVHSFLAMRYTEAFWQDKTVSWKHVGEQIGRWLAKSSKVSEVPAIEMDENGMPIGYREMQEARRRADAIVAEKRRNGELR